MKHPSSIILAVAFVTAAATACFDDPTSSLRNGPNRIELTRTSMLVNAGDSSYVLAVVKDEQGNTFDASDAVWTSSAEGVATVRNDTTVDIPFRGFSKGFIRGVAANGGVATIGVASHGLTAELRVVVLPTRLTASAAIAVSGTARADSIVTVVGGVTNRDLFNAGDTVTITTSAGGLLTFDAANSQVSLGPRAYIISRSATAIKAIARAPFRGRPWVTRLTFNGPAEVGTIAFDSLQSDSILVSRAHYYGTITQTADTMFVNAQAGTSFADTGATLSGVRFDTIPAIILSRTAALIKVISPVNYTGPVTVTNVRVGSGRADLLTSTSSFTMNMATFGGTIVTGGRLLDTVKVLGTAVTKLDTGSVVTIAGRPAWVVRTFPTSGSTTLLDSVFAFSRMPSTGTASVSRVVVAGTLISSLATAGNVVISDTYPTGEVNEPANDAPGAVTIDLTGTTASNPLVIQGAVDGDGNGLGTDADDFFAFTLTATSNVRIQLQFAGTGAGGATNPDLDLLVCNAACSAWVSTAGATGAQPENITLTNRPAGTYNIYVNGWDTGTIARPYKLIVYLQ